MDEQDFLDDLMRYIEEYKWDWGVAHKLLNQRYNCNYTIPKLKKLYQATIEGQGRFF